LITDYLPDKRIPGWRKLFAWGLNLGTVLVGIGLYEFETNDVGITEAVKRIWHA
jgi:succinate dehydrogenase (ubiquinone) membrane anchor subunit